jgi:hypothetical protein
MSGAYQGRVSAKAPTSAIGDLGPTTQPGKLLNAARSSLGGCDYVVAPDPNVTEPTRRLAL